MMDFMAEQAGLIGLLLFFFLFVGIAVWSFLPARKKIVESYKYIPLSEEKHDLR